MLSDDITRTQAFAGQRLAFGPYRLIRRLGEGGMGVVWEAEQINPQRRVALKLLRAGAENDEYRKRLFRREAAALARLRHPAIATIYESGETPDGSPYLAMELVQGRPFQQWLDERGPLPPLRRDNLEPALRLFCRICEPVAYAHQRGVIHRDLKPANLFVTEEPDGSPGIKVLDFGIARILDDSSFGLTATATGLVQGSLPFMSPEQVQGLEIDTRSDVYSLGILLYMMLTGGHPYFGDEANLAMAARLIVEAEPKPLPARDTDLRTIVEKALEKNPARRYQSASDLAADVQRYLANEPIGAMRPGTLYQIRKLMGRNRLAASALCAIFLLSLAFAGVTAYQANQLRAERDRAEREANDALQVSLFLGQMFLEANPANTGQPALTARDLLDRGAQRLERESSISPRARMRLYRDIASSYSGIGESDRARALFEQAIALHRKHIGTESAELGEILRNLAVVHSNLSDFPGAVRIGSEAVAMLRKAPGVAPAQLAQALTDVGLTMNTAGDSRDAERLLREAIHVSEENGLPLAAREETRRGLAVALNAQGRYTDAEPMLRALLEDSERARGPRAYESLRLRNDLGNALALAGRPAESAVVLRVLAEIIPEVLGPEHMNVAIVQLNLANSYLKAGDLAAAAPLIESAARLGEKSFGKSHPRFGEFLRAGATLASRSGRHAEAEVLFAEALKLERAKLGEDAMPVHLTLAAHAEAQARAGNLPAARRTAERVLPALRARLPATHPDVRSLQAILGTSSAP